MTRDEFIQVMGDLMILALQTDLTTALEDNRSSCEERSPSSTGKRNIAQDRSTTRELKGIPDLEPRIRIFYDQISDLSAVEQDQTSIAG